ncbi:NmrA family transcriptional regulator [Enterovibrio sp. ZSDZ35]|uniref:NmrA family transcriptional regulator n=1 Tax=Enterovibrio qingdaonensis TaxID=2899818 RepID=A0ABT5QQC7_9GAMM|nr:NmrA family NAD(P)-binding protein [Enterovibrio sp. ZSDZ35]MDD1783182.1 NmrA family transcriptional regulator [Enterovibrio sp. ZSDZ35]
MTNSSTPIAIIGKNAKTGARVNKRLIARGIKTRPVSRSTSISFDWGKRSSWPSALKGVRAAYVTYQPDLAMPEAENDIRAFVEVAKSEGVEHLVLLSGRGEEGAEKAEKVLINSGLAWNVVRASWFAQNFSESFMAEGVLRGELVLPAGNIPEPFIDIDDIADVVVAALLDTDKRNRVFEVTGPELMTFRDCVDEIAKQRGKETRYTSVSMQDYLAMLKHQHVPDEVQWLLHELFTVVFDGRNSSLTDGVEAATGRKPTKFAEYVTKTIEGGYWG